MIRRQSSVPQSIRLLYLLIYLAFLFVMNRLAFGQWLPQTTAKGLWFYSGAAALILGSLLVTPFFTSPANAISYLVAALIAVVVFPASSTGQIDILPRLCVIGFCSGLLVVCCLNILWKDSKNRLRQNIAEISRILADYLGSPRFVFAIVIVYALWEYHRAFPTELFFVGIAGLVVAAQQPLETLGSLLMRIIEVWHPGNAPTVVGQVVAFQTPGIVLIRQQGPENTPLGTLLFIMDPHAPPKIGIALDYTGRDEGKLLRAIELAKPLASAECVLSSRKLPEGAVVKLDDKAVKECESASVLLGRSKELVGIVAPDTSIERLYFEVIQDTDIEESRLVEAVVGEHSVLYQIIDGLTREEIIHQKNTYGYARAQAQKIGRWDEKEKKFKHVAWIPKLNAPVFLKSSENFTPVADVIGHFPKTNCTVRIKSIHDLVTHNTAILGILGVGKSMLGIELVERMIAEGIKVVCLDLTNQYAEELVDFYDNSAEDGILNELNEIGKHGKSNFKQNVEEGGSINEFSKRMQEVITSFMTSTSENLKIFNPANFEVWRQDSKLYQEKASMASLTPTEITRTITESVLNILQQKGMAENNVARVCLVYEEAHSLVPEWTSVATEGDKAATNGTARAILQGRKYGLGCLLITQRTANVTKTVLNQCNTIFAMRSFDETGKKFLADYLGKDHAEKLPLLRERHAVFFGKASSCENPVTIRLNDRDAFIEAFRDKYPPPGLPTVPRN